MLIISAKLRIFFVKTNFYVKIFMNNCIFNKKKRLAQDAANLKL